MTGVRVIIKFNQRTHNDPTKRLKCPKPTTKVVLFTVSGEFGLELRKVTYTFPFQKTHCLQDRASFTKF